ncbi:MAG: RsmE family RNA methyltransferase [Ignavibacteria bacterium]|nr:RsmE family RNA methyltransferase [Ignavibacteria bacterium]
MAYLSNIELYYSQPDYFSGNSVKVIGEEFAHLTRVMRHKIDDDIYVTDGCGKIYTCQITNVDKTFLTAEILSVETYVNKFQNIYFCIPKLKSPERFEFALEKCVELGITNFIIYESMRTVAKSNKVERWEKILLAAMKQSLRSYLPKIHSLTNFKNILELDGTKILFEQNAQKKLSELKLSDDKNYYFIFGPEGGLDKKEIESAGTENLFQHTENRLRSETAVVYAASQLDHIGFFKSI